MQLFPRWSIARVFSTPILVILLLSASGLLAVTSENICDTDCEFCCRERQCRTKAECEGDFSALKILAIVVGCIVALVILRCAYVRIRDHLRGKKGGGPVDLKAIIEQENKRLGKGKAKGKESTAADYLVIDSSLEGGQNSTMVKKDNAKGAKTTTTPKKNVLVNGSNGPVKRQTTTKDGGKDANKLKKKPTMKETKGLPASARNERGRQATSGNTRRGSSVEKPPSAGVAGNGEANAEGISIKLEE
eukprot:TRINITY_DN3441_c0_g1_i1.p1 TRINITY_DN3441_c0_g1~~TRINITY_DN3441_c0_g1_i1.p1  ORF type:complete len:247 (-),score=51.43 TRINITY_DN3441_c0_g1_i1:77-817(-)